jgi:hypothetical protein
VDPRDEECEIRALRVEMVHERFPL